MADLGWTWPGSRVTRVIDGDTIDALLTRDLGFGGTASFTVRLRLARINAPALHTKGGAAARDVLASYVRDVPVDITTTKPYKYGGPITSPGEWLAEIIDPSHLNLSDHLVSMGHAVYWDGTGPRPHDGDTP